jgi:hypothetical protein
MRTTAVLLFLASAGLAQQTPADAELLDDQRVTFRLRAANAADVVLNSDGRDGRGVNLSKDDQGVWHTEVGPLEPRALVLQIQRGWRLCREPRQRQPIAGRHALHELFSSYPTG